MAAKNNESSGAGSGEYRNVIAKASLGNYFASQVETALEEVGLSITSDAQFYIVNILTRFASSDDLAVQGVSDESLVMLYQRASEASPTERIFLLRRLGDGALYISGFFADSLAHSLVDVDYYAAMGGKAYSALAGLFSGRSGGRSFARLYDELSSNYFGLIDVLNVISERTTTAESVRDAVGLIRLYERWERTKSERLQRALQERGVFPVYGTDYQMH